MSGIVIDLYAGAGGWSEGLRAARLGPTIGLEIWHDACRTAVAAGHRRVRADVATYPTSPFAGRTAGLVASPPCQPWSAAGNRLGEQDQARVHELVDAYAAGSTQAWQDMEWADERSHHAAQPVRWLHALRPEWTAMEQVPAVLPLWRHIGRVLTGWGYSVWTGVLNSADYGVPQTRRRAILIASRARRMHPPEPTHYDPRRGYALFGAPWLSMAEALGWATAPASVAFRNGNRDRSAVRPAAAPAPTIHFGNNHNKVEWVLHTNRDQRPDGTRQTADPFAAPAPSLTSRTDQWVVTRPATTITGDPRIPAPGHRDRAGGERQYTEAPKVAVAEASILQSFRPDYPWQGTKTSQYTQVGNAVPPLLAETVARVAAGAAS